MLYISVFCKHNETHLNKGYNLVLSAERPKGTPAEFQQAFLFFNNGMDVVVA